MLAPRIFITKGSAAAPGVRDPNRRRQSPYFGCPMEPSSGWAAVRNLTDHRAYSRTGELESV